ncbi:DUF6588 family protein [Rubrolithibacter danxiaensis]|uniref:DUF6588 family protein n=1 Tax=Rubrolithibacter danxiaensis TaxID=3390805 RepID=UPI003BF87F56
MKRIQKIVQTMLILTGVVSWSAAFSQTNVSDLIKSSPADATKMAEAYLNPFFKGFGFGLNSGWNYTAKAKNAGRFELRVALTGSLVPSKDKTFDVTTLGLSNSIQLANGENPLSPTVSGSKVAGPLMNVKDSDGNTLESFNLPAGANLPIVPTAQIQGTIGLPKGIDLTLRGIPEVKLPDNGGAINMIGGGIKLEILPLIAGKTASKVLPFDLAVALGYTQFNYKLDLDARPVGNAQPKDLQQNTDFSNQQLKAKLSGVNAEVILSKKLLAFIPFVSVGYNTSKTDVALKGNYPVITDFLLTVPTYTTYTDPVKTNKTDISGLRGNVGFQLNLAVFRLFAAYSLGEYSSVNAGIGLGFGK